MRILLTGAAGFIGSHVARALLHRGDEVIGLDSFDPYYAAELKERNVLPLQRWPGWYLVRGDIRDQGLLRRLCATDVIEAVVHLAARAGVRPSIDAPAAYVDTNVGGTVAVIEAARAHGVRRFVVASSSSVYGADSKAPFAEDARADRPVSPYAASKRAAELLCTALADLHELSIASLRYFTVYGPAQRPDMAIMQFIRRVDAGEPIARFGDGSSRRDYTYVDDAVLGTLRALDATADGWRGHRVYNIGEASTVSLSELIACIERAVGRKAVLEPRPPQPGDVPLTHADLARSRAELGYAPGVDLDEGIRRQVEWYRREVKGQVPMESVDAGAPAAPAEPGAGERR
jgi:UDP-glucuronate 4-epimerase